jgi:prevent-host-death family protein
MIVTATQARRQFLQLLKAVERGTAVSITYKDTGTVFEIVVIEEPRELQKKRSHK